MDKEIYLHLFEKYMENKAGEQEIDSLVAFIKANPQLNHWFELRIRNSSDEIDESLKQKMFAKIQEKINETEKPNLPNQWLSWSRVAAAIILPIFIALGSYYFYTKYSSGNEQVLTIVAESGEKANVILPDGSRVWLNSSSKLTYYNTYNKKERILQLDGEAYFEVTHDEKKKFIVRCMDMEVEVLGTTFGIKAFDEDSILSTVLVEGKVKVTVPDKIWLMNPSERITYNKSEKNLSCQTVNPNDFTDWRKNRLRFENETLQDIAKTIARIYNIDYAFTDESIKTLRFTGSVDNANIGSVLNAITLTSSITYTVEDSLILFKKDNKKK